MALQTLNTVIPWPQLVQGFGGAPSAATRSTLSSAGHYDSIMFYAREAMTISHIGFRCGTASGSPTADVRIETVGATGDPSGTLWATNTNAATATLVTNTWALTALTASASIAAGQLFALKIAYASGTSFITQDSSANSSPTDTPYQVINTASAVRSRLTNPALMALGSGSTTFYGIRGLHPVTTFTSNTFNNTSSARRGLRFQVPFKCRAAGIRFYNGASTGDFNIAIFDDGGSELSNSSTAIDGDSSANLNTAPWDVFFDNPVTLSPGTWYRAALEPSSATNITIHTYTLPSASYRSAMPHGSNAHYTTYVASSWTDTATDQIPLIDILIDQLDDGASAGSGSHMIGG